jgi:O-antigen ligase
VLAALLSVAQSAVPLGSVFYSFQLLRTYILIVAVAKVAHDPRVLRWIALGLATGIIYQATFTVWQKANGAFQAAGTMGHQNLLGLMSHFVTFPLIAMLLGGMRSRLLMLGVAASLIVVALGASRGAIGFTAIGIALLLVLSLVRNTTPHKLRMVGLAAVVFVLISPLMVTAIQNRMGQHGAEEGNDKERLAFERAAKAMWTDHPMGVGANQYVVVANTQGYSQRAGVAWNSTSRAANVHNAYLLVAAETGWIGLITFIVMLGSIIWSGFRFAFQDRHDPRGEVVLGCTVAVFMTSVHNFYEWIFVIYQAQYTFAVSVGIIVGMIWNRALERRRPRQPIPNPTEDFETSVAGSLGSTMGGQAHRAEHGAPN